MPAQWTTFQVILVLFLATLVRSAFGFGEEPRLPLCSSRLPSHSSSCSQDWRRVHARSAGWLGALTLLGIP